MSRRKPLDEEAARALGARLREARGEKTQASFALQLGIDRATLANYESGRRIPNDEVLRKYQEATGKEPQALFFGSYSTPFHRYVENINKEIVDRQAKRPGFIPKFTISDDELALIKAFRLAAIEFKDPRSLQALELIIASAADILKSSVEVPVGEASVDRLRKALSRGYLEEGFDPDAAIFHTFEEERWAERYRVRNRVRNPEDDSPAAGGGFAKPD